MERGMHLLFIFSADFQMDSIPWAKPCRPWIKIFSLIGRVGCWYMPPVPVYCSCCICFFTTSAYNKKWDRQPLRESLSLFSLGLFCNSPMFLLILRDFYKPSSGSRKSIFMLLLQSSSFINIGSAASFLRFPALHWHSSAEPMHRNMLLVHLV